MRRLSLIICICWALAVSVQAQLTSVDDLLAEMSLEQKVGQMMMMSFYGAPINEPARDFIAQYQPGAVALFPSNLGDPVAITNLTNTIQQTSLNAGGLPLFVAVDQEGGIIAHLEDGFTRWPVSTLLTATGDAELAYRVGEAYAQEMRAVGVNMNLAPIADLHTNRDNPIIGRRSFGSFPGQVAPIITAWTAGLEAGGVMATGKHFPGHGDTDADSHVQLPVIPHDLERLQAVELVPFQALVDAGVGSVMVAHIVFPELDDSGLPASLSPDIVTGLLRNGMAYDGIIMTDALDMDAIDTVYSPAEAALMAVKAGHDLIAIGAHVSFDSQAAAIMAIVEAVRQGDISESRIDASVRRILTAKARFGVLDWSPLSAEDAPARIGLDDHQVLIEEMFMSGSTLVYDRHRLLPATGQTLVIYPGTQPALGQACSAYDGVTPLAVTVNPTEADITTARNAATTVDQVIVFTQNAAESPAQQTLVQALPADKTIVVAMWSPYDLEVLPDVAAYVLTYSPLRPLFAPVCGLLFGDTPFTGQLSVDLEARSIP